MVLPPRLRSIGHKVKTGHFRDALQDLQPVYDPTRPLDRLLMADIRFHTGQWRDAEALANDLTNTRSVPAGIQGRAYELLTWLVKHQHGVPSALGFAEKSLQQASKANDLEQTCRAQLAMLVAKADAFGPDSLGTLESETQHNVIRSGDAHLLSWLHIRLAEVEARRGRFDLTERHLDLAAGRPHGQEDLLAAVQVHLLRGVVATLALHPERSMAHNRDALTSAREAGYHFGEVAALLNMGQLCLSMHRLGEARDFLDAAEPLLGDRLPLTIGWTDTRAQLALAQGDLAECQRLVNRLATLSEIDRTPKPSYSSLEVTLTRVRLQRQLGDTHGALALLDAGVKEARTRRSRLLEATFQIYRADLLLDTGQPRDALQALRAASRQSLGSFITLLAEAEQVRARIASSLGLSRLATARNERACRIYHAIGRPKVGVTSPGKPVPVGSCGVPSPVGATAAPGAAASAGTPISAGAGARSAVPEDCLLMLESAASLMELGGRPDLLADELFTVCRRAIGDGRIALVSRRGTTRELRRDFNWTRAMDDPTLGELVRISIDRTDNETTYELLLESDSDLAAAPLLDALQTLVDASARVDAVRVEKLEASTISLPSSTHATADAAEDEDDVVAGAAGQAIFSGPTMKDLLRQAQRVGRTDLTVLITGETGVGKEILADEIRRASARDWTRYAKIVCSAIPRELLESSLFGHTKGSFTGADRDTQGVIRAVDHGTVLLDEIGELSLEKQVALLRLIDAKEVHPLGADRSMSVDVRFICATNANLEQLIHERRFREDLFHRINVVTLRIPPLRERREEILPLARHFLTLLSERHQRLVPTLSDEAAEQLLLYGWPGNVRELRNEMERLIGLVDPDVTVIRADRLSDSVRHLRHGPLPTGTIAGPNEVIVRADQPLRLAVEELEREIIARRIREGQGNLDRIAQGLGLSRKGLYFKRQRHGLT